MYAYTHKYQNEGVFSLLPKTNILVWVEKNHETNSALTELDLGSYWSNN